MAFIALPYKGLFYAEVLKQHSCSSDEFIWRLVRGEAAGAAPDGRVAAQASVISVTGLSPSCTLEIQRGHWSEYNRKSRMHTMNQYERFLWKITIMHTFIFQKTNTQSKWNTIYIIYIWTPLVISADKTRSFVNAIHREAAAVERKRSRFHSCL